MLFLDIECYSNYFLISFLHHKTGKVAAFELHDTQPLQIDAIKKLMNNYTTVSFNGLSYDLPMIAAALKGFGNARLKLLSDSIIKSNLPSWRVCKDNNIFVPKSWDHIDLIEVAPGQASLKIYGGRMNAPKMQDLPLEPDAIIRPEQFELMREYCANDLRTTQMLYEKLSQQIALRQSMSEQYGVDLRSKSDAQIAETVIKSELTKLTGNEYRAEQYPDNAVFHYHDPQFIEYQSPTLKTIFDRIVATEFTLGGNGSIAMPDWLKDTKIKIGRTDYQMGIGGLHSCEKSQYVVADESTVLRDADVASYYPSIILQQKLSPKTMGKDFITIYQSIVTRRIEAKHRGDKVTADTLKICVNGSFGKLGSKYSALYAPELLIQTTLTGQLALLMLIEKLEENGISVVSANTDGIVSSIPKHKERVYNEICFDWMLTTSYELEFTDYKAVASRDVNNYIAVKTDGKIKRKGVFAETGLSKNPDATIIFEAVAECVANGAPIEQTITQCKDITKFVKVRRVQGGAVWRDAVLGKAVRFYYSNEVSDDECIRYAKNSNKVPKSNGARPLMDLPDVFPSDVNYLVYIEEANELLKEVGFHA